MRKLSELGITDRRYYYLGDDEYDETLYNMAKKTKEENKRKEIVYYGNVRYLLF